MALSEEFAELLAALVDSDYEPELGDGEEQTAVRVSVSADSLELSGKRNRERLEKNAVRDVRKKGGVYVNHRPDGRPVVHAIRPRILKNDIRRSFPQMYCNMQNSDDPRHMQDFIDTFASSDLLFNHVLCGGGGGGSSNFPLAAHITLLGRSQTLHFWDHLIKMMPDKACRLLNARVTARSDGTGMVEFEMDLCGTVMLHSRADLSHRDRGDHKPAPAHPQGQCSSVQAAAHPASAHPRGHCGSTQAVAHPASAHPRGQCGSTQAAAHPASAHPRGHCGSSQAAAHPASAHPRGQCGSTQAAAHPASAHPRGQCGSAPETAQSAPVHQRGLCTALQAASIEASGSFSLCHAMESMRLVSVRSKARILLHLDAQNVIRQMEFLCSGDVA